MSNSSRIKHMIQNPSAHVRYLATGQLPQGTLPKSPLIDLLKAIDPRDRGDIRGLTVDVSLGYTGSRQFHNAHHALTWAAPRDEVFGSFPAESCRHKGFQSRLYLEDLAVNSADFPDQLFAQYSRLRRPVSAKIMTTLVDLGANLVDETNNQSEPPKPSIEDQNVAADIRWKITVLAENAGDNEAGIKILALLEELPPSYCVVNFVRTGFNAVGQLESLAYKTAKKNTIPILEYILANNRFGIGLEDVCTWKVVAGFGPDHSRRTLAEIALEAPSPAALRLAIKLTGSGNIGGNENQLFGASLPALHFTALLRAVLIITLKEADKYLECAEILAEYGVPVVSTGYSSNPVGSALLCRTWKPAFTERFTGLLRQYHTNGHFDVNAVIDAGAISVAGLPPLDAAIKSENALAAKELIALGCCTVRNMDALLNHVRSMNLDCEDEMLACVKDALMTLEINRSVASGAAMVTELDGEAINTNKGTDGSALAGSTARRARRAAM